MTRSYVPAVFTALLACLTVEGRAASEGKLEARVVADTLTLRAEQAPLQDVLGQLQEAGIRIRVDPRVNPPVTANFKDRDLRSALEALLDDCDYALFFSLVDGPAGAFRRISEVDVYMRGDRRPLAPLPGASENLNRTQASAQSNTIVCVRNEVLIRFKRGVSAEAVRDLMTRMGGSVVDSIPAIGLYRVRLAPGSDLQKVFDILRESPAVERAEPNLVYRPVGAARVADGNRTAVMRSVTAPAKGTSAVAVLDTGLLATAGLEDRVLAKLDVLAPDRPLSDALGHGTQMALIASGLTRPDGPAAAAAGDAGVPIIPIRAFDDNGFASGFALMQSMIFALDHGARVVSMSWGSETDSGFFNDAVAYASQRGAVLVAAAGNQPTGNPLYPAACSNVVAVAALTPEGEVWSESNYGSFVALAAPGFATFPVGYKGPPGSYAGTSVATAFTANTLGRYFALHPDADARQALDALAKALTRGAAGAKHPEMARLDDRALASFLKP